MKTKRDAILRLCGLILCCAVLLCLLALQLPARGPGLAYDRQTYYNSRYEYKYYVTRYTIWNNGSETIEGDTMAAPLTLRIDAPESVFFLQLMDVSDPLSLVTLDKRLGEGEAALAFDHLDPGARVTLTMYHNLPTASALDGRLAGNVALVPRRALSPELAIPFVIYSLVLLVMMLGQAAYIAARLVRWPGGDAWTRGDWRAFLGMRPREHYERRRRTKAGLWITRHWPVFYSALWVAFYLLVFL